MRRALHVTTTVVSALMYTIAFILAYLALYIALLYLAGGLSEARAQTLQAARAEPHKKPPVHRPARIPGDRPIKDKVETLRSWTVLPNNDGTNHEGCTAHRRVEPGVSVDITVSAKTTRDEQKVKFRLSGVSFGIGDQFTVTAAETRGLIQIDDGMPYSEKVEWRTQWQSLFETNDAAFLAHLGDGHKLTVVINGYKYDVPLVETSGVIRALATCNVRGQESLNEIIVSRAKPATVRREAPQ